MAIIKKKIIKLSKSSISNVEVNSVKKVLDKEYLGMGPEVKKFEETCQNILIIMLFVWPTVLPLYN